MHLYTLYLHEQFMADRHRRLREEADHHRRLREAATRPGRPSRCRPARPGFAARLLTALLYW